MIVRGLVRALDSRLRIASPARKAMSKIFPDHWTFMFGEIALYAFGVLVLTGTFLALFFEPSTAERVYQGDYGPLEGKSVSAAFSSTVALSFDVRAGLLMRQTHHWAALVFVGAIVLHLARVFFTGAFRRPREINWLVGVTMLILALVNGFTGYSMPDDLLSGTGLRIIYAAVESIPVAGAWLAFGLFGGEFPAEQVVPRMFFSHVFAVPILLGALIALHMLILIRQKHTQFPSRGRTEHNVVGSRFWPGYTIRTMSLFAAVLAVLFGLGGLVQINPVWIYGPFDPARVTTPAQPDWYVAWGEGALRLFPEAGVRVFGYLVPSPFVPGVVLGAVTFLALYSWPFLEKWCTKDNDAHQLLDRPRDHPVRLGIGVTALAFYGLLVAAASDDVLAGALDVPIANMRTAFRIMAVTVPLIAGVLAYFLAQALRHTSAGLGSMTAAELKAGLTRRAPPVEEEPPPDALTEVWRQPGGTWRWRYVERDANTHELVLTGTSEYPGESVAEAAAGTAYPGVPVRTREVAPTNRKQPTTPAEERIARTARPAGWGAAVVLWVSRLLRRKR